MRSSPFVLALLLVLPLVGVAGATAPIPPFARTVYMEEGEVGVVRDTYYDKPDPVGEQCLRHFLCVGPFFPHIEVDFGNTGFRVLHNDTNVTAGHDAGGHEAFGPYVVPTLLFDDVRVCWSGCKIPSPLILHAHGNYTLMLYVLGLEPRSYTVSPNYTWEQPDLLPEEWGCSLSTHGCEQAQMPLTNVLP